jgi:hypothetical protein
LLDLVFRFFLKVWIPVTKGVFPVLIEHAGPDLQQEMGSALRPLHLLLLYHALAYHLIDRRLLEVRADQFTVAVTLAVVWDELPVLTNVGVEFLDALQDLPRRLVLALERRGFQVELQPFQFL